MPASFGRQYISPLVSEFLARHPRLKLHLDLTDQMRDLASEGFDLAIRIGKLSDSSLVARRLAPNRRVLCASPEYLRRRGTPRVPEDLASHDCLLLSGNGRTQGGGRRAGIALHSTWHVCEDLRTGRLQVVLPDHGPPPSAIYALEPSRHLALPRARAFADFLAERFGRTPPWDAYRRAQVT